MGTISQKALYLNETKRRIKDRINLIGGDLDDTNTFREYAEELDSIYDDMPKVEGEGSNFTINQTRKGGLEVTPKGNCEQEVIAAVAGTTVEGSNLTVNDFDTTKEMSITPLGNCEQNTLPSEYQAVEYIESSGTQYINTGIKGNSTWKLKIQGVGEVGSTTQGLIGRSDERGHWFGARNNKYNVSGIPLKLEYSTLIEAEIIFNAEPSVEFIYDNIDKKQIGTVNYDDSDFIFFSLDNSFYANAKLYYAKCYQNNILVREFIPCYRISDNEIGLYDLVNGVFYTNSGTGTFIKGNDVNIPNPDYPQDIKVVTGDNQVLVQNKNLIPTEINNFNYTTYKEIILTNPILAGDYTTSAEKIESSSSNAYTVFQFWYEDGTMLAKTLNIGENRYTNFTLTKKVDKIRFYAYYDYGSSAGITITYTNLMLEKGSTATTYVPHAEQSTTLHLGSNYLAGIGDYRDEIVGYTDEWKIVRNVAKAILKGTDNEIWSLVATYTNNARFTLSNIHLSTTDRDTLSNYFIKGQGGTDTTNIDIHGSSGNIMLTIPLSIASTVGELKTWLSTHNTIVYGILATPTETPITNTTLINDLNAIYNLTGYSGTTNIMTLSATNNAEMPVEVHYNFVTPSPSPNRPSEVKTVSGENSIKVENKNLANVNNINNVTWAKDSNDFKNALNSLDIGNYTLSSVFKLISINEYFNFSTAKYGIIIMNSNASTQVYRYYWNTNVIGTEKNLTQELIIDSSNKGKFTHVYLYGCGNDGEATMGACDVKDIQVEYGQTASTYVAHAEQTYPLSLGTKELCKIGAYEDKIVGIKDNWKIQRYIGKIILDETSILSSSNQTENYKSYYLVNNTILLDGSVLSNYFSEMNGADVLLANVVGIHTHNTVNRIYISVPRTIGETWTTLQQWFGSHNTIIYYQLATPTETPITDTTLISQLNAIYNAQGYDGQTNIMTISPSTNADLVVNVKALKEFPTE